MNKRFIKKLVSKPLLKPSVVEIEKKESILSSLIDNYELNIEPKFVLKSNNDIKDSCKNNGRY